MNSKTGGADGGIDDIDVRERIAVDPMTPSPTRSAMKTIMVRYKTSEAHAEANESLVRAVFEELRLRAPSGLRYASYRLADGVTFVHIATVTTADGSNPLDSTPEFAAFTKEIAERCEAPPVARPATLIGSYNVELG